MHTGVVQAKVVLVGVGPELSQLVRVEEGWRGNTNLLVIGIHSSPSSGTLSADSSLCEIWAKVIGDDGSRSLHVEEEWCERTLGGVGIMLPLLALLLVIRGVTASSSARFSSGADGALKVSKQSRIVTKLAQAGINLCGGSMVSEDGVGVFDVGTRESLDGILKSRETGDNLFPN